MAVTQVATNLYLEAATPSLAGNTSQPVDTTGASSARVTISVQTVPAAGTLDVYIEGSNDLTNWFEIDTAQFTSLAAGPKVVPDANSAAAAVGGYAYVRVRWAASSSLKVVLSATLSLTL